MTSPQPITVQVYCRLTVTVEDSGAVTGAAVEQLRRADIDWSDEEDDLATAAGELSADLLRCLAGLADPGRMLAGTPGISVEGGHVWAEHGGPDPGFVPGGR
ncbi:hypothetical protein [Actinoplanes teichomyceticus]|uniref:Uncharacterized protein n=1 Tax=Actinoplanes teichomyceticus TaxID=1867 RepID=A0A561VGX7_ACTTI|nr:hypothetical protein [Actinoplanes teichomyceticus]TWG10875.1 hypothetical protein FHX34_107373 [Actinoplanes teichomyceticus]GIF12504.1 hypothetical protein Ate01nite_25360 [Actinoplanes teichomyceticus]